MVQESGLADSSAACAPKRAICSDMSVRQVAHDFPACREVFVRYGEPADRQPFGHLESLERFSKRRGVPISRLMSELSAAARVPIDWDGPRFQRLHRGFLAIALLLALTIGCGWGAWLLWQIGIQGTFDFVRVSHVVAHGNAQLWGFVALFITGISLRWLPMATANRPPSRVWTNVVLLGITCGVALEFVWETSVKPLPWLGWIGSALLVGSIAAWLALVVRQVHKDLRRLWAWAVLTAAVWWLIWAIWATGLRWRFANQGPEAYPWLDRQTNIALALLGVACNAVYGFGLRLLPGVLGGSVQRRRAVIAVTSHNVGVAGLILAGRWPFWELASLALAMLGAILFACSLTGITRRKRWTPRREQSPILLDHYVRVAFLWWILGLALWAVAPAYTLLVDQPASHALRGAARHALTVGFLTTLIMGMGQRLVPIFEHTVLAWPKLAWPTLLLIATGNIWRVVSEIATIFCPPAFWFMPWSSLLEWMALALFATNLCRTMWPPHWARQIRSGQITLRTPLADLLSEYPELEDTLLSAGIPYLMRVRSVPRELTLETFFESNGLDAREWLPRIRQWLASYRCGPVQQAGLLS